MKSFVIDADSASEQVEVIPGGGKVMFTADGCQTWFELTKDQWEELKDFVDEMI